MRVSMIKFMVQFYESEKPRFWNLKENMFSCSWDHIIEIYESLTKFVNN